MTLVSVVIPSCNYGDFIVEAVESALRQTHQPLEIIVVDDGSTDNTRELLTPFCDRIQYVYQNNRGLSAARNAGIRMAKGEWVALLDADDVWHPQKTKAQLFAASEIAGVALIGSRGSRSLPANVTPHPAAQHLSVRDFLLSSRMGPSGTLIRRECFDVVGLFDEALTSVEDRDMWLRIAARFPTVQVVEPCWWHRPHEAQMSRQPARMLENYEVVLTKFFRTHPEYISLRRLAWSFLFLDASRSFLDAGDIRAAWSLLLRSVHYMPWSLGDSRLPRFPRARLTARLALRAGLLGRLMDRPRENSTRQF